MITREPAREVPDDGDLPNYVIEAFETLNKTLRKQSGKQPISWIPVDVRVVLPKGFGAQELPKEEGS